MKTITMITPELVSSMIDKVEYQKMGDTVMVCNLILKNGFNVSEAESCVDPAAFDEELGKKYSYEKAFNAVYPYAAFLMKQQQYEATDRVEKIARLCHEVNRAYCEGNGDYSCQPWENSSEQIKESARISVKAKLEQDLTPEDQHALWCNTKRAQGWKTGPVKDEQAKTHPCLVPYSLLPVNQRVKDYLFGAVVSSFKE